MVLDPQYEVAGRDVVSENFDGDVVVLDLNSGKYFSFTDTGCGLWEAISAGVRPQTLVGASANYSAAGLESFVQKLLDHRLIRVAEGGAERQAAPELIDRIRDARELPDVSVFEDLADLFLADPIHDVEEPAGWPVIKKD